MISKLHNYFGLWSKVLPLLELKKILTILDREYKLKNICPKKDYVFKAFKLCPLEDLKVVFLGLDPYPQKDIATGILFGNNKDTPENMLSPSLRMIRDAALDLSGYKYILMHAFMSKGFTEFRTYSPITIKATAGCAKRGSKKEDMITRLGEENNDLHLFIHTIWGHSEILKKKTAYVNCVDDLADAYWCLKTTAKKENISCILSD